MTAIELSTDDLSYSSTQQTESSLSSALTTITSRNTADKSLTDYTTMTLSMTSDSELDGSTNSAPKVHESNTGFILSSDSASETTTASVKSDGLDLSTTASYAIFIAIFSLLFLGVLAYFYFKNRPCVSCKRCLQVIPARKRTSSTSSQAQLTQDDATFVAPSGPRLERELFSIADQDGGDDGRPPQRNRRGTEDDYFYDEIFERSAFVDESTNRANKHLTIEHDEDDEELGDMNVPDLIFKKPNSRF